MEGEKVYIMSIMLCDEVIDPGKETDDLNVEEICYCNGPKDSNMLQCILCRQMFHLGCLKSGKPSTLVGDVYFDLTCAGCSPDGTESCTRQNLSWLQAVYLSLYNLYSTGSGRKGYFRWREDICRFIDRHWPIFFPKKKKTATWCSTVAGILSSGCPQFFKSGQKEFNKEMGWWALLENLPPAIKLGETGTSNMRKRKREVVVTMSEMKTSSKDQDSVEVDSYTEETAPKSSLPGEDVSTSCNTESDELIAQLLSVEELQELERLPLTSYVEQSEPYSFLSVDGDSELHLEDETKSDDTESIVSTVTSETSCRNTSLVSDTPQTSNKLKIKPVKKPEGVTDTRLVAVSEEKEKDMLFRLNSCPKSVHHNPEVRRFRRKLLLRQLKRAKNLPIFDLDRSVTEAVSATLRYELTCGDAVRVENRSVPPSDLADVSCRVSQTQKILNRDPLSAVAKERGSILERFLASPHMLPSSHPQSCSFLTRLVGGDSQTMYRPITSPYTARILKPFIRRDSESRPVKLRLLQEIVAHHHRNDPDWAPPPVSCIDYCYVQPHHIPSVNAMCREFFWPGIDLSECLQYPDFSCVVLYKKFVIGFAFMVPDVKYNEAYISFVLVHPEWRRAGIGTYMLYHLIQTCMGKDVTLHVSVTNPAMLMYQKFGFKPEEFILDFYNRYLPENSPECRHAFFLRLRR